MPDHRVRRELDARAEREDGPLSGLPAGRRAGRVVLEPTQTVGAARRLAGEAVLGRRVPEPLQRSAELRPHGARAPRRPQPHQGAGAMHGPQLDTPGSRARRRTGRDWEAERRHDPRRAAGLRPRGRHRPGDRRGGDRGSRRRRQARRTIAGGDTAPPGGQGGPDQARALGGREGARGGQGAEETAEVSATCVPGVSTRPSRERRASERR